MLYIVPTPIGNLSDITDRAIKVLGDVDMILCEDTRTSGVLLKHLNIKKPLSAFHMHNEHQRLKVVINDLSSDMNIALISDSGTPGISDPGFLLVRECIEKGIKVECLPGPIAFVPALVISGLPCDRFCFEGFLPHKKGRLKRVLGLLDEERTMIFYESPHRVIKTLELFMEHFGADRRISVSREITKMYEETIRGTIQEVRSHFENTGVKGEFVIVVAGKSN